MHLRASIIATAFALSVVATTIAAQSPLEKVAWANLARTMATPRPGPMLLMFWENNCSPCQETLRLLVQATDLGTMSLMPVATDQLRRTMANPELETAVASTASRFKVPAPWLFAVPGPDARSYEEYFERLHRGFSPSRVPAYLLVDRAGTVLGWHEAVAVLEIVTAGGEVFTIDQPDQKRVASAVVGHPAVDPLLKAVALTWRASVEYSQGGRTMTSKVARNPKDYADAEPERFVRDGMIRTKGLQGVKTQASLPISMSGAAKNGVVSVTSITPLTR